MQQDVCSLLQLCALREVFTRHYFKFACLYKKYLLLNVHANATHLMRA